MRPCDACPAPGDLQALLDGTLSAESETWLSDHLGECVRCQLALESLAGGKVRDYPREEGPNATLPQALHEALVDLQARPALNRADTDWSEELLLRALSPAEDKDCLGRLGHYEVTAVLGRGAFGIVLQAFDPTLHRLVALKVLAPHLASSAAARLRFAREARAAAAVWHENLVGIYGVDEANGLPYLVMEYVAGASLQQRLDRGGPVPLDEVLRIGLQAARGLAAAHAQGLIHRDIKPANILLEHGLERVKITDFGLARAADDASLTQSGVLAGTPQYMAPEQARGEPLDHRADLFSLGSVLYALCAGRPPFRAGTTMAVLRRICDDVPRPLQELNSDVPRWLSELIALLHAKDPAERIQTAAQVAELLGQYLVQRQQPWRQEKPPPLPRRPSSRARARGVLVAVLSVACISCIGAAVAVTVHFVTAPRVAMPAVVPPKPERVEGPVQRLRGRAPGPYLGAAFAPDGTTLALACSQGAVQLWGLPERRLRLGLPHHERVWAVAYSRDGRWLVSAAGTWDLSVRTGEVRLWDTTTLQLVHDFKGQDCAAVSVALSPDGRAVASGGLDGAVRLWDATTGELRAVCKGNMQVVRSVAFSPDGQTLACSSFDGTVRLLDPETGAERACLQAGAAEMQCVAFSPDGQTLAVAENEDEPDNERAGRAGVRFRRGRVALWDLSANPVRRGVLTGARGAILSLAFAPDGRSLASGGGFWSDFGEVIVWDLASAKFNAYPQTTWAECVAFTADGRTLVSGGGAKETPSELHFWDVVRAGNGPPALRRTAPVELGGGGN
jgi:serine/threonine-protein kinase